MTDDNFDYNIKNKEFLVDRLSSSFNDLIDQKKDLEDKAMKIVTITSIMIPIVFGFISFLYSTSGSEIITIIQSSNVKDYFVSFTGFSIISSISSLIFALVSIKPKQYHFIIMHNSKTEKKNNISLKDKIERLKETDYEDVLDSFMDNYSEGIMNYSVNNGAKGNYIQLSYYLLLSAIGFLSAIMLLLTMSFLKII